MLTRIILCELLVVLALFATGPVTANVHAGEDQASIRGVIYWDRDADGEQDGDEPGIGANPVLTAPDSAAPLITGFADEDGRYEIVAEPGTYRLDDGVPRSFEQCAGVPLPSYNPFGFRDCVGADYPITSDRFTDPFDLAPGETIELNIPVTTRDEMILLGRALVDRGNAPAGSTVTAMFDGNACGSATIPEGGSPGGGPGDFELRVLGAAQREGCPEGPSDVVTLQLNGVDAAQQYIYVRFSPVPNADASFGRLGIAIADLAFFEDYAWVWSDDRMLEDGSPVPPGTPVRALIGDVVCGETVIGDVEALRGELSGFGRLFVASAAAQPGCGSMDTAFDIVIGDRVVFDDVTWEPLLFQLGSTPVAPGTPLSPPSSPPSDPDCPPGTTDVSPPQNPLPDTWPLSPPAVTDVTVAQHPQPDTWAQSTLAPTDVVIMLQEVPVSPPPASPPPSDLPLSPPQLSPPPSPPSGSSVCVPATGGGAVRPPDTGTAGLKDEHKPND